MLRSILRNVQYYLLFFSILLVLLAFQRLQWYDQGLLPHPYAFTDGPMQGRGFTSPDNAGKVYYGGDESKEIGLFKFRLGLLKFALPIFSKDNAAWERTNELSSLMTVPHPPNKRRKSTENMYLRLKAHSRLHSKSSEEQGIARQEATLKSSVAYVVVIPQLHHLSKLQMTSNTKKIKVLSKSIGRAHTNSPFEYQLYALNLNGASITNDDGHGDSKPVHEALIQSEFKIINVNEGGFGEVGKEMKLKSDRKLKEIDEQQQGLLKLLNQHAVIVQINLNSFLLKPLDDLFGVLLGGNGINNIIGVVDVEGEAAEDGKSDEQTKKAGPKSTQVELFALESFDASSSSATSPIDPSELIIFRSSSQQATNAYMKRLQCVSLNFLSTNQSNGDQQVGGNSSDYPSLRPSIVARKNQDIDSNSKQHALNKAQCGMQAENSLYLDPCLYDAGNFNIGHNCSNLSVKEDARVAHFPEGMAAAAADIMLKVEVEGDTPQAGGAGQKGQSHCVQPWECLSEEDCSQNKNRDQGEICTWLCSEWFSFVSNK